MAPEALQNAECQEDETFFVMVKHKCLTPSFENILCHILPGGRLDESRINNMGSFEADLIHLDFRKNMVYE